MVCLCAVKVCRNSTLETRVRDSNLKFHPFPKRLEVLVQWIYACHREKGWLPRKTSFVCSDHFLSTDFERDLKAELLNLPPKKILKHDAIPSLLTTSLQVREHEMNERRLKFQQCLQEFSENSNECNESLCDLITSKFGVPKIIISSLSRNVSEESEIEMNNAARKSTCNESKKNIFNLADLCRLCGSFSDSVKSIIDTTDFDYNGLIQKYFPSIKISKTDSISQVMCSRCENSLISWYRFWEMCNIVNLRFQFIENLSNQEEEKLTYDDISSEILFQKHEESENTNYNPVTKVKFEDAEHTFSDSDSDTVTISSEKISDSNDFHEPAPEKRKRIYKSRPICDICKKSFRCSYTKRIHMQTVHTDERPFLCNFCTSRFKRKDHLQSHVSMVHEQNPRSITTRRPRKKLSVKYLCSKCGKVLCSKTSYREHVDSIHNDVKKYHCEQCNVSFNRYSKLYRHKVVLNHGKNQFLKECDVCGLEFESEIYYIRHLAKHDEVVNCEKCCIQFSNNQEFKDHVSNVHFEKREFSCKICSKTFGSKTSLFQHKKAHENDEKPYQCEHCNWRFKNRGHLVVHMYRHTGERPYTCTICNRGFKQKGDMRKHKAGHILNERKCSSFSKVENNINSSVM